MKCFRKDPDNSINPSSFKRNDAAAAMKGLENQISFHINGQKYIVTPGENEHSTPSSLLVDYIRDQAGLKGTKYMCREAGCGACVCTVKIKDPVTGKCLESSINTCVTPVLSCDGWDISTIEKLGNHKDGYSLLQQRLVGFSGTQCGFCTPGMIMNMHGLLTSNDGKQKPLTAKEIEDSFDGNICRCTGFRPILDAFKSFASDASENIKKGCEEFEKTVGSVCPLKDGCVTAGKCLKASSSGDIEDICCHNSTVHLTIPNTGQQWIKPTNLTEALKTLKQFVSDKIPYRIIAGNTSTGIFKHDGPYIAYLDVNGIPDLRKTQISPNNGGVYFGAGVKLTQCIELLKEELCNIAGYEYADRLAKHWLRVANVPVRNAGTIAGNLMIKYNHIDFPSDIFLTLQALGAMVNIASSSNIGTTKLYSIVEFLKMKMDGNLIVSIHLPSLPKKDGYVFRSYKITKRYQNAHAYINGAMVFKVDSAQNFKVLEKPRICFGGINPDFIHATSTENFLVGKSLNDPKVVQMALETLEKELNPDFHLPDASPEYRKMLARNLLYKTILGIIGSDTTTINPKVTSGGGDIEHKVTSGQQKYDTIKNEWPIGEPVTKIEGPIQCSGEAEYVNDIPKVQGELFGVFVLARVGNAELKSIDASEALSMPGVVALVTAKDIPGENNFIKVFGFEPQQILYDKKITAAGQPIGLLLAETRSLALEAAKKVKIEYQNIQKPILTIQDAVELAKKDGYFEKCFLPTSKTNSIPSTAEPKHKISGEFQIGGQYHFHMETHVALCIPKEGGLLQVYSASQFMDQVQVAIAGMLKKPNNEILVQVRRLGGGFGGKGSAATQVACICALGTYVTNRPVRVVLDLETNMSMLGKRTPYLCQYKIGFDDNGKIHALDTTIIGNGGAELSEADTLFAVQNLQNCYEASGWEVKGATVKTNTPRNLFCRAPGTTQGIAMIETILEHIAHYLKKDPLEIRLVNLMKDGSELLPAPAFPGMPPSNETHFNGENFIPRLLNELKTTANYEQRKSAIIEFNKTNRWIKKGLSIVPMRWPLDFPLINMPIYIAIYHTDGTVVITHGGIEMGQGINTKVAQVVGFYFNIPLNKIKIRPTENLTSANSMVTGGSLASDLASYAAVKACMILKDRLEPIKTKLGNPSWEELISNAHVSGIDLRAMYQPSAADGIESYNIWGICATEVEVDILTGEFKIARMDVIEDAGKSMSPEVDIGQVEGSIVMGLGLWTLEKLSYDPNTGELLTNNTWEYKPPFAKDIPEDFRVTLLSNAPNPVGVHGSKATGEPPFVMSVNVVFALKQAIDSARQDAGNYDHYQLDGPITPESIVLLSLAKKEHLVL